MFDEYAHKGNVKHNNICINKYYVDDEIKKRQDNFLDSYNHYLKHKIPMHKNILERKVIELELIDPTFNFYITD